MHHAHSPQEFDCHPRPTRWPTFSVRTPLPAAATVPITSWPGMNGYWLMPQSFEIR